MTTLLAKFKVYPKGRWYFFHVYVWKKRSQMHRALREAFVDCGDDCEGICCSNKVLRVKKNGRYGATGQLGHIHFHAGSFAMGTITHECTHAAIAWAKVARIDPMHINGTGWASDQEESFCWVLGNIARQVVLKTGRQWKFPGKTVSTDNYS